MRIVIAVLIILGLFFGIIGYLVLSEPEATPQTLSDAETALANKNADLALKLVNRYLSKYPDAWNARLIQGNIYTGLEKFSEAYDSYQQALTEDNPNLELTRFLCGRAAMGVGRAFESEQHLREVLKLNPRSLEAHSALFYLMRIEGRNREMREHYMESIRQRQFKAERLLVMVSPYDSQVRDGDEEFVNGCLDSLPDDPLPMMGQARGMIESDKPTEALPLLVGVRQAHPQILTATALLGKCLLRVGTPEQITDWVESLPEDKDEDAEIWWVRGQLAERNGDRRGAARCYWESLKRDPLFRPSCYDLGQTLAVLGGYDETAKKLSEYAGDQSDIIDSAFEAGPKAPEKMREVAEGMLKLGRIWEATGWCYAAMQIPSEAEWGETEARKLNERIRAEPPFVLASAVPANSIDLSDWDVPEMSSLKPGATPSIDSPVIPSGVAFSDQARKAGMGFQFFTHITGQSKMYEFSGGGASVVDFDRDGWPDVYLTQGAELPVKPEQTAYVNQLFRNINGQKFEEIAEIADVADNRYGQGAAIGDFDNDGFSDVFVTNIGGNELYRNNGDGTFSKSPIPDALVGNAWTIGGMIVDLNDDGNPDIYALNYLGGDDVLTRKCDVNGTVIQCSPGYFPAAADQVFFGDGSGGFTDATEASGLVTDRGKGMGVTAFRMKGDDKTSVLIANDTEPNYLFRGDGNRFEESGILKGIALGATGRAQSCMGVAAGDVNNDGAIDFLVTNYTAEANNLYVQQDGFFEDRAEALGIRQDGIALMGWGAQFLDANLDGYEDLLVANGHLENREGAPMSKMPAHFFHNVSGRFVIGNGSELGDYFEQEFFGRAVARLDWNRDGLPDAVMTHRSDPVSLLTNVSAEHGESVRISLIGTVKARDAVGAVVQLKTSERTLARQVMSGDGFQAANQQTALFGLPKGEAIESVKVTWPGGATTLLTEVAPNSDLVVVEGLESSVTVPH